MNLPLVAFVIFAMTTAACAADWSSYTNARFGASIDIPPGFVNDVPAPANGDGLTFHSVDGQAELLIWGNNVVEGDFKTDGQARLRGELDDGWDVSYRSESADDWHVYSGSKGDRIMYLRSISSCKGTQALHFRIEYPKEQNKDYDSVVERLGKSLRTGPASDCP